MKEIKDWLIVGLLTLFLIFNYKTLTSNSFEYRRKIEDLHSANTKLNKERSSIDSTITEINKRYKKLQVKDSILTVEISKRDQIIADNIAKANKSKAELDKIKSQIDSTRSKIYELKKSPPNRTGSSLINSLKLKLSSK
jgi:predicted nuclease with TOPRIM domain